MQRPHRPDIAGASILSIHATRAIVLYSIGLLMLSTAGVAAQHVSHAAERASVVIGRRDASRALSALHAPISEDTLLEREQPRLDSGTSPEGDADEDFAAEPSVKSSGRSWRALHWSRPSRANVHRLRWWRASMVWDLVFMGRRYKRSCAILLTTVLPSGTITSCRSSIRAWRFTPERAIDSSRRERSFTVLGHEYDLRGFRWPMREAHERRCRRPL